MTTEQIQNQIYKVGSIAFLKQVHDALAQIAIHDPLSAHFAAELEELIIYQEIWRLMLPLSCYPDNYGQPDLYNPNQPRQD